jgi:hypothetical protein
MLHLGCASGAGLAAVFSRADLRSARRAANRSAVRRSRMPRSAACFWTANARSAARFSSTRAMTAAAR